MHDGGPIITTKYMWMASIAVFVKILLAAGWIYLLYLNSTVMSNDPQLLRTIRGAVCGFFVGWNVYDVVKYSKTFIKEYQKYKLDIDNNSELL